MSLFTEPIVGRRKADEQKHACFLADADMHVTNMATHAGTRELKMAMHVMKHRLKAIMARKSGGFHPVCMHVMA